MFVIKYLEKSKSLGFILLSGRVRMTLGVPSRLSNDDDNILCQWSELGRLPRDIYGFISQ